MKVTEPPEERDKHRIVLKLLSMLQCPKCGQSYNLRDFTLVDRKTETWVLSSHCRGCDNSGYVIVALPSGKQAELMTDQTVEEREASADWAPINADDVLDMHAFMEEFDGDFETLFTH